MDNNEIIALSIVALAALRALRCFLGKKSGGCCGSGCLPGSRPKFEKKENVSRPEDKK
ncbi:MAG: hypothetical protein WCJ71_00335 [Candidatus Omnitrophota bacterium]